MRWTFAERGSWHRAVSVCLPLHWCRSLSKPRVHNFYEYEFLFLVTEDHDSLHWHWF